MICRPCRGAQHGACVSRGRGKPWCDCAHQPSPTDVSRALAFDQGGRQAIWIPDVGMEPIEPRTWQEIAHEAATMPAEDG